MKPLAVSVLTIATGKIIQYLPYSRHCKGRKEVVYRQRLVLDLCEMLFLYDDTYALILVRLFYME